MDHIKKSLFLSVAMALLIIFSSAEAGAEKRIGVLMFSDETRYIEAVKGIMDKLREEGYGEPQTKYIIEKAGANKAKTEELVQKFAAAKFDLIITVGTSSTIPVAREIKDVPIVFTMVYDPVEAGIAKGWKSSGNNTTGTSPLVPMSKLLESLKEFAPVKRLAVLYTPGEKNSEAQLKDLQKIQANYKIRVFPVPLTTREEVVKILPEVIRTSDALYITGSNLVNSLLSLIVDIATRAKVVTITHLADLVGKGVLLSVCSDPYKVGRLAGEKAVRIFKGAKPSSIPIESLGEYDLIINMKTAKAGQFQIPLAFMKKVKREIR